MADLHYGNRVRQRREALGLSREVLAQRVGTSTSTMDRIELKGHLPSVEVLRSLADMFDLTLDELLRDAEAAA